MAAQVSERPARFLLVPSSLSTMILCLLLALLMHVFPVLWACCCLGVHCLPPVCGTDEGQSTCVVDSQPANVTEPEPSEAEANQTSTESNAGNNTQDDVIPYSTHQEITSNNFSHAAPPGNETSRLYNDEKSQPDELQNNQTSFIPEDDENFQKQETEFPFRHCDQDMLVSYSHNICGAAFHTEMQSISSENWCVLEDIIRPYNDMTHCLEEVSYVSSCYYPHPNVQEFFLDIHSIYFHNCSSEELLLVDAPHGMVITLTVIPVSFIPLLVYLVMWNSKGQK